MKARTTDATDDGIVSPPALPYAERERISWHYNREGAPLCIQKLGVNRAEED
jgi:hypothetical protein